MKVVNTLLTIAVIAAASSSAVAEPTGDDLLMAQFGTTDVDPAMTEAFRRAALPVTPELRTKALECWENNGCDTGSGGDLTVAYADGFGENVWRRIVAMEYIQQALTYPEVGKIIYTSARGDAAKSISDLRSYVAQGGVDSGCGRNRIIRKSDLVLNAAVRHLKRVFGALGSNRFVVVHSLEA